MNYSFVNLLQNSCALQPATNLWRESQGAFGTDGRRDPLMTPCAAILYTESITEPLLRSWQLSSPRVERSAYLRPLFTDDAVVHRMADMTVTQDPMVAEQAAAAGWFEGQTGRQREHRLRLHRGWILSP
ncbi:hypothetical protein ACLQ28_01405 [Micromonospora sp. DT201]|uniref:hypothetical protein n=1 Tax=Micromonospora sp. DT201 TaxID=3393442 RepID=UPI003CEF68E8